MPRNWVKYIFRLILLLLGGIGVGAIYGEPLIGGLFAALIMLGWQLYWLYRLERWVKGKPMRFLPDGSGIWPEVFARIDFIRGRGRIRNKRFKQLAKEMRNATKSFPDGGIILDADNGIITMNHVAEDLLGLKHTLDRGMRVENLIRAPEFVSYLHEQDYSHPVEIPSPLNGGRWIACHLAPYGLDQKLLLVRDVTRERKADEMRRDFVANASHELRTPLTVITGYLEVLAEDLSLNAELRMPVEEMQRQSERMQTLVNELLRLSELESEGPASTKTPVNITAVLNSTSQAVRAMPGCPAHVEIEIMSDADLCGDEADLQSVVSNLVANAARYTPADGTITMSWQTNERGGFITVRDSGTGIGREHIPRLTERFYRVENGRERIGGEGGNGLGLAIVKHALNRHSATLTIESELGVGSTFICQFPSERIFVA
jgi:two-component system phosphate regulon sensor histidine kinase PhoR